MIASFFKQSNPRGYAKVFGAIFCGVCLVSAVTNLVIDPWAIRYKDEDGKWKLRRPFQTFNERLTIPWDIERGRISTLILGSSRVRYILTQGHERRQDPIQSGKFFAHQPVFNAAIAGVNIHVIQKLAQFATEIHPVREALLQIDFEAMNDQRPNAEGWDDARVSGHQTAIQSWVEEYKLYFTPQMFVTAIKTIHANLGSAKPAEDLTRKRSIQELKTTWMQRLSEFYREDLYGHYTLSPQTAGKLDATIEQLRSRGIPVTLMTPAIHATLAEMIWHTGNWPMYEKFLGVLAEAGAKYGVEVWTYSPYHRLTTIPSLENDYFDYPGSTFYEKPGFYDAGHSNWVIGERMLALVKGRKDLLSPGDESFGIRLTPDNLPAWRQRLRAEHAKFVRSHPEEMALIPPR